MIDYQKDARLMTRQQLEAAVMRDQAKPQWQRCSAVSDRLNAYRWVLRQKIAVEMKAVNR